MIRKCFPLIVGLVLFFSDLNGQQIHYSQFFLTPQTTNAAQIGDFSGTARIGGIHRSQWLGIEEAGANSTSLYIDAPVIRGFRKNDWVGVGVGIVNDVAGIAKINVINLNLGLSYHLALSKDQQSVLSFGAQLGANSLNIDDSSLRWEDGIRNSNQSVDDFRLNSDESTQFRSVGVGVQWKQQMNKMMKFKIGFAVHNINKPEMSFFELPDSISQPNLPSRNTISGQFGIKVSKKLELEPLFLIQSIESDNEMLIGMNAYTPVGTKNKLQYGAAYRLQDAFILYLGLLNENYRLGLSYDFTVSELASYSPVNFELGGYYIIKKFKQPKLNPFIFCPRY